MPSKALISTANAITAVAASRLARRADRRPLTDPAVVGVDLRAVDEHIGAMVRAQSEDVTARLVAEGVRVLAGTGRLDAAGDVVVSHRDGRTEALTADTVLLATGARPRRLPERQSPTASGSSPGSRSTASTRCPERLVVVGSGVTGAEFAGAYRALHGADVALISSRDRVLPGEDPDAARVLEDVFRRRGVRLHERSRAASARRTDDGVEVTLTTGEVVTGSHVLLAVGSLPNTDDLGLAEAAVATDDGGYIRVDRVSRTSRRGVYAAGDCTGVLLLGLGRGDAGPDRDVGGTPSATRSLPSS